MRAVLVVAVVPSGLVRHRDRGVQYASRRYSERPSDAGLAPSVGRRGNPYDNALAECTIGHFWTEVTQRRLPWPHPECVEFATLAWVDWFNRRRLLEPIGCVPAAEREARHHEQVEVA